MTRFRNAKLGVFRQHQNTKTILKKKNMRQNRFKKLSKFQKFYLGQTREKWIAYGLTYSKELQQKMKMSDKLILKNIRIKQFLSETVS